MSNPPRKWTNKIRDAMQEGVLDPIDVAEMCLHYMSEADVEDMCQYNDILQENEDAE